jgi:hypothetical protein
MTGSLKAQIYPIQATTQLVPPYAVYLPDYATGINNQLRVLLLNKDVSQPDYKVKLVMSIELNGTLIMRTSEGYAPAPITLQPNVPFSVEGLELAPYMNSANIDFIGYSRQDYEQKKGLPEGSYKICFTAYDYYRPDRVQVSNAGCSFYYLTKNDPPFVNMPACGIFITPLQDDRENLIDRAGRWLSYTLDLPWDNTEKNLWYDRVEQAVTETFDVKVNNAVAKNKLYEIGRAYAGERHKQWDETYGEAWAKLVMEELTKDDYIYWSRTKLKTGATEYQIDNTPQPTDASLETEVDLSPYIQTGPVGNGNINFMWTPRHTSSPNSTLTTKYRIELYEVRPKTEAGQLPAMANNAVMTSPPVFTDETDLTSYTYGPDRPALIDGLQYAWRVRAFDAGGRDWFKNNGYSEVCYFTFGGVYNPVQNVPGMEEINTFNAQAETERRGMGQWTQTGGYTGYRVRYRRKNGSGTWFEVDTDSLNAKLYDLEPSTAYQAQVQGKLGQYYGPFSAIKEFTTPAPTPPPGCGLPIDYASGLSNVPVASAGANMFIKCGKFEIQVDTIQPAGGPGYYTGSGRFTNIVFLNLVQVAGALGGNANSGGGGGLRATFSNIFINENREVTQGTVYAVSRPLEEWLGDWDEYYKERRDEQQQAQNRDDFNWLDSSAAFVPFEIKIRDVAFDKASGTITVTGADGNTYTYTLKPEEKGHDVIVQGNDGNQWVIKKDGTVVAVPPPGGLYPGMNKPLKPEEADVLKLALSKLRAFYTTARMDSLRTVAGTAGTALANLVRNEKNQYNITAQGNGGNSIFMGRTARQYDANVPGYQLGLKARNAQRQVNIGTTARAFARETNSNDEFNMIAGLLKVNNTLFRDYVAAAKAAKTTEQMAEETKKALLDLIAEVLDRKIYNKK